VCGEGGETAQAGCGAREWRGCGARESGHPQTHLLTEVRLSVATRWAAGSGQWCWAAVTSPSALAVAAGSAAEAPSSEATQGAVLASAAVVGPAVVAGAWETDSRTGLMAQRSCAVGQSPCRAFAVAGAAGCKAAQVVVGIRLGFDSAAVAVVVVVAAAGAWPIAAVGVCTTAPAGLASSAAAAAVVVVAAAAVAFGSSFGDCPFDCPCLQQPAAFAFVVVVAAAAKHPHPSAVGASSVADLVVEALHLEGPAGLVASGKVAAAAVVVVVVVAAVAVDLEPVGSGPGPVVPVAGTSKNENNIVQFIKCFF